MLKIFSSLKEKFYPIDDRVSVLSGHFASSDSVEAHLDTEGGEIYFRFKNFGYFSTMKMGAKAEHITLVVEPSGMTIVNQITGVETRLNYRERRLLQKAIWEWSQSDDTEFKVVQ